MNKKDNQFKKNICYFYSEVTKFQKEHDIQDFVDFFLNDVSILPIQTEDSSPDKAREKALKIFETINNRGLSLSDSDIFKAKLYSMALNDQKHEEFIEKWKKLDDESQKINHTINDIFRFYTQVIRGENNVTKSEIGLREFFTQTDYSPFKTKQYNEVLDDLFKITESIKFFQNVVQSPKTYGELTKWFQLINKYTNQYPLNALIVYIYQHGFENQNLIDFSKNLVRYAYYHGSTSKIKFFLFSLISKIVKGEDAFEFYPDKIDSSDFEYFGLLKKGYTLLVCYLDEKQEAIYPNYFNKIINPKDAKKLNDTWNEIDYYDYSDSIGNMMIIDQDISRDMKLSNKKELLMQSSINEVKNLTKKFDDWSYQDYQDREKTLRNRLKKFFKSPNVNK